MKTKIALGLLILGLTNLQAGWNPFSTKWQEDCKSDIMTKGYTKSFEEMIDNRFGKGSTKAELISKIEEISKKPLKCKVTLQYKIILSSHKYREGVVSTVTIIKGIDENGNIDKKTVTMDDRGKTYRY